MLTRRALVAGVVALPVSALPDAGGAACGPALLDRAIVRLGGRRALSRVRRLGWAGTARVHAGGRTVDIGVRTELEPFGAVRSTSWLLADGPGRSRALVLDRDGLGWVERDGRRTPMSPAMARHERQQYATYALMLLAPLCTRGAVVRPAGADTLVVDDRSGLRATMAFDAAADLVGMTTRVDAADGGGTVEQTLSFADADGRRARFAGPVRWPRALCIAQGGKPYFELTLFNFAADAGPIAAATRLG